MSDSKTQILAETCRLCVTRDSSVALYDILGTLNNEFISEKITKCTRVEISATDECLNICEICLAKIDMMSQIYEQFEAGILEYEAMIRCFDVKVELEDSIAPECLVEAEMKNVSSDFKELITPPDADFLLTTDPMLLMFKADPDDPGVPQAEDSDNWADGSEEYFPETTKNKKKKTKGLVAEDSDDSDEYLPDQLKLTKERDRRIKEREKRKQEKVKVNRVVPACPLCNIGCAGGRSMNQHIQDHANEDSNKCCKCFQSFENFEDFKQHIQVHAIVTSFACDICNKKFGRRCKLASHKLIHPADRPVKCSMCDFRSQNLMFLKEHEERHFGEKRYECPVGCNKVFKDTSGYKKHMKDLHTEEYLTEFKYACSFCDRRCQSELELNRHKIVHRKFNPFVCEFCDKGFPKHGQLLFHRQCHTGIKLEECEFCGKRFSEAADLTEHKKIHSGLMPYQCEVCQKEFSLRWSLKVHLQRHFRPPTYCCEFCNKGFRLKKAFLLHKKEHREAKRTEKLQEILDKREAKLNAKKASIIIRKMTKEIDYKNYQSIRKNKDLIRGQANRTIDE